MNDEKKIRVLITKIGLDAHDRGAKAISTLLREAGMEVVYLGRFQTPESIVKSAMQEDVDVIGISSLCGAHLVLVPEVISLLSGNRVEIPVILGGVIPREDIPALKETGVSEVFTWGSTSDQIAKYIQKLVSQRGS